MRILPRYYRSRSAERWHRWCSLLFAAYGSGWEQNSLGVLPILYGMELSNESVVGGTSFTGTVTLLIGGSARRRHCPVSKRRHQSR